MRKVVLVLILIFTLRLPVCAAEFTAPTVPESGAAMMPEVTDSFGAGLLELLRKACSLIRPDLSQAAKVSRHPGSRR